MKVLALKACMKVYCIFILITNFNYNYVYYDFQWLIIKYYVFQLLFILNIKSTKMDNFISDYWNLLFNCMDKSLKKL
jgi:hypothetical protein